MMQPRSSSSSGVRWADPALIDRSVRQFVADLRTAHPEIQRVYWYGSWVTGRATPSSDVDLCIIVSADDRRPRDRIPYYLPERFPTGVDLTVFTESEWAELPARSPSFHTAVTAGRLW